MRIFSEPRHKNKAAADSWQVGIFKWFDDVWRLTGTGQTQEAPSQKECSCRRKLLTTSTESSISTSINWCSGRHTWICRVFFDAVGTKRCLWTGTCTWGSCALCEDDDDDEWSVSRAWVYSIYRRKEQEEGDDSSDYATGLVGRVRLGWQREKQNAAEELLRQSTLSAPLPQSFGSLWPDTRLQGERVRML